MDVINGGTIRTIYAVPQKCVNGKVLIRPRAHKPKSNSARNEGPTFRRDTQSGNAYIWLRAFVDTLPVGTAVGGTAEGNTYDLKLDL